MKQIKITPVDMLFLNHSYPIEFLLYYKNTISTQKIRRALKSVSSIFWPVFGIYQTGNILQLPYSESDIFDEEIREQAFEIHAPKNMIYRDHHRAVPAKTNRLFYVKIIQYTNGTVLIPKLNHLAGDGYSYFYFLSVLFAFARGNNFPFKNLLMRLKFKPFLHRSVLFTFSMNPEYQDPPFVIEKPVIENEQILKKSIQHKIREVRVEHNIAVSTNDILCAMVLKRIMQNMPKRAATKFDLSIPIDVRQYIKEYGPRYFGNGLMFQRIGFQFPDLDQTTVPEIAIKIRRNMPQVSEQSYLAYLSEISEQIRRQPLDLLRPYDPDTGCLVTNLSKMPVHRLDFGAGRPDLVVLMTMGKNSVAILSEGDQYMLRYVF